MSVTDAIVVEHLVKRFGKFTAVDDVSFGVPRGQVFGFLGPNGAGKTTVIRVLLGLLEPTSGVARVLGCELPRQAKALHARAGYMSQVFTLYNDLTARENIGFYGRLYGLSRPQLRRRQREIIEMAGLRGREDELASGLSGGWRQRLALGCAIIHEPEMVFLDEPTAGVDPVSRREFWTLIYELAERGTTVFVTTHYMDEAEHCQRLGFIDGGRLVALGTPDQLRETQMRGEVLEVHCSDAERAARVLREAAERGDFAAREVALYGARIHALVTDGELARPIAERVLRDAGISVTAIDLIEPTLEDVFISSVNARESGVVA